MQSFQPTAFFKAGKRFKSFEPEKRNGIVAVCSTGTAAKYPVGSHGKSAYGPVDLKGIKHIFRA